MAREITWAWALVGPGPVTPLFLSHSKVVSMETEVLKSIDKGYEFF